MLHNIEELPEDILLKIFGYCSTIDLLIAAKVCPRFRKVACNPALFRNRNLHISNSGLIEIIKTENRQSQVKCFPLNFAKISTMPSHCVLRQCFREVQSICLDPIFGESNVRFHLASLLSCFPKLVELDLSECKTLTNPESARVIAFQCRLVKVLKLRKCYDLKDNALKIFVQGMPYLHSLDIAYCRRITPEGFAYLHSPAIIPEWEYLNFDMLNLPHTAWEMLLRDIAHCKNQGKLRLRVLSLKGNIAISPAALSLIAANLQKNDHNLLVDIKDCDQFVYSDIEAATRLDASLQFDHNCKLADYSEKSIKSYLGYLLSV